MQQDRRSISPAMQGFRLRLHNCQISRVKLETQAGSISTHLTWFQPVLSTNIQHYARKLSGLLENGKHQPIVIHDPYGIMFREYEMSTFLCFLSCFTPQTHPIISHVLTSNNLAFRSVSEFDIQYHFISMILHIWQTIKSHNTNHTNCAVKQLTRVF